ncbi:MAG TPA: hypothetical protein VKI00_17165 [Mycobacterium sp.]|uniref:hypothetical protein n=1 Tax=Mycobacterium sp. TaxID=1785 RepID=UPI002BE9DFD2|nr:hypothetical protein [Mycobacterium sp.]HME77309.1 hypothetical protein [Mycobacterium sp.]
MRANAFASEGNGEVASVFGNSNEVWAQDRNNDLAGVFGNSLDATATGANYLVDILPSL